MDSKTLTLALTKLLKNQDDIKCSLDELIEAVNIIIDLLDKLTKQKKK